MAQLYSLSKTCATSSIAQSNTAKNRGLSHNVLLMTVLYGKNVAGGAHKSRSQIVMRGVISPLTIVDQEPALRL